MQSLQLQTNAELELRERAERSEILSSFETWLKSTSPQFQWDLPHLKYMRKDLDLIIKGKHAIKEMFFLQPQSGKSLQNTIHLIACYIINNPENRVILISSNDRIVSRFSQQIRAIVRSQLQIPRGKRIIDNIDYWETGYGGFGAIGGLRATGVNGAIASFPADLIVVDDPIKDTLQAKSEAFRNRMWDWWSDVNQRAHNDTSYLFTMTRRHQDDLAGRILEHEEGQWKVVKIPALSLGEEQDALGRPKDVPFWPERFSYEFLCKIRASHPERFQATHQQEPSFEEGNKFKYDNWQWYKADELPQLEYVIISLDGAWTKREAGEKNANSFSVYTVWGYRDEKVYFLEIWRKQEELPEVKQVGENLYKKYMNNPHNGILFGMVIEDQASGKAIIQELERKTMFNIIKINPIKSKEIRAEAVLFLQKNKHIYLPNDDPAIHDYIEELAAFPKGKTDDQVDSSTQAWQYIIEMSFKDSYYTLCE